jgi:hypothetical protein
MGCGPTEGFVMKLINAVAIVGLTAFTGMAWAAEGGKSLGFYVGGEIGSATANTTVQTVSMQAKVDSSTTGWSVFAGFRPQKFFGAELSYIDFGSAKVNNVQDGAGDIIYQARAKNSAIAGYIIGYLPLLPSKWDVFAKAGYSRLSTKTDSNGNYPNISTCNGSSCQIVGMASTSESKRTGDFAYGIGTQYRFGSLGLRVEYQKITASQAKPDMFSVGVAWNF